MAKGVSIREAPSDAGTVLVPFVRCALMAALLAVLSWISLPFYPVPLTLQTLGVLLAGAILGPWWGLASVALYLALGMAGLPVFHNGLAGPGVFFGPTGGYLLAFLPAAFVMGWFGARPSCRLPLLGLGAALAELVVYSGGLPWLALQANLSLRQALVIGMLPFLLGDVVKAAAAVLTARAVNGALAALGVHR